MSDDYGTWTEKQQSNTDKIAAIVRSEVKSGIEPIEERITAIEQRVSKSVTKSDVYTKSETDEMFAVFGASYKRLDEKQDQMLGLLNNFLAVNETQSASVAQNSDALSDLNFRVSANDTQILHNLKRSDDHFHRINTEVSGLVPVVRQMQAQIKAVAGGVNTLDRKVAPILLFSKRQIQRREMLAKVTRGSSRLLAVSIVPFVTWLADQTGLIHLPSIQRILDILEALTKGL